MFESSLFVGNTFIYFTFDGAVSFKKVNRSQIDLGVHFGQHAGGSIQLPDRCLVSRLVNLVPDPTAAND
jgi:hypothetical protein